MYGWCINLFFQGVSTGHWREYQQSYSETPAREEPWPANLLCPTPGTRRDPNIIHVYVHIGVLSCLKWHFLFLEFKLLSRSWPEGYSIRCHQENQRSLQCEWLCFCGGNACTPLQNIWTGGPDKMCLVGFAGGGERAVLHKLLSGQTWPTTAQWQPPAHRWMGGSKVSSRRRVFILGFSVVWGHWTFPLRTVDLSSNIQTPE